MSHLLNGFVDTSGDRVAELERRVVVLEAQQARSKEEAVIAVLNLLGNAMRQVATGQIDLSATVAAPGQGSVTDRMDKWEAVKKRLGNGNEAQLIEVLLACGPRTNTQLKSLLKLAYSTVAALTLKMSNLGFLTRVGDAWGLKD